MGKTIKRAGCTLCGDIIIADTEDWNNPLCPDHYFSFLKEHYDKQAKVIELENNKTTDGWPDMPSYIAHPQSVWFHEHWLPIMNKQAEVIEELIAALECLALGAGCKKTRNVVKSLLASAKQKLGRD